MLGEEVGQVYRLVGPPLRDHHHTPNLLHLRIVRRTHTVQVASNLRSSGRQLSAGHTYTHTHQSIHSRLVPPTDLCAEVRDDDELLEHVLGQDVGEASLLDVIRGHVDVVGAEVEVGGGDGPHTPLCLGGESLTFIVAGCCDDDLVSMFVDSASGGGCQLRLLLCLLLNLCNLLALLRGSTDLHAQDDVPDLRLSQGGHIHTGGGGKRDYSRTAVEVCESRSHLFFFP